MTEVRTTTYPIDAMDRVASRLQDLDWNLPRDEARALEGQTDA